MKQKPQPQPAIEKPVNQLTGAQKARQAKEKLLQLWKERGEDV